MPRKWAVAQENEPPRDRWRLWRVLTLTEGGQLSLSRPPVLPVRRGGGIRQRSMHRNCVHGRAGAAGLSKCLVQRHPGLNLDYYGSGNSSRDIPADLDAMITICAAHVEEVLSMVPAIFVLGPVVSEGGAFGNGENVWSCIDVFPRLRPGHSAVEGGVSA